MHDPSGHTLRITHALAKPARARHQPRHVYHFALVAVLVLMLAGFLHAPAVGAAPSLTLTPDRGSCATRPVVRGTGFPAGASVVFLSERTNPPGEKAGQPIATATTDAAGAFQVTLLVINGDCIDLAERTPNGTQYVITAAVPQVTQASAGFTIDRSAAGATASLALDPSSGPCDTVPTAIGRGFPADLPVLVQRGTDNGPVIGRGVAAADGTVVIPLAALCDRTAPLPPGTTITVIASPGQGAPPSTPPLRVATTFTVTSAVPQREQCFTETGYCVGGRFLAYWEAHGGLALNGLPLTKEFDQRLEDGNVYTVQYFERVRLEWHPRNTPPYDVLLGQFGRTILATAPDAPTAPVAERPGTPAYFHETGHNVGEPFWTYWWSGGGLAQFGYPLTEPFTQTLEDGQPYTVQYFERARFEWHPENADPQYQVLLGQFGRRILTETSGAPPAP